MRARIAWVFALLAALPVSGLCGPDDRVLAFENDASDVSVSIADAAIVPERGAKTLSLIVVPAKDLGADQTQAIAERLFGDYAMTSAARLGASKVWIYMRPANADPQKAEVRDHLSTFSDHGKGVWQLSNRWNAHPKDPPSVPDYRLDDGTKIVTEDSEVPPERLDGIMQPTLHVEILLDGLNPMMQSDQIYTTLKSAWTEMYRPQAEQKGLRSVELVAHVQPRESRFEVRDATVLQLIASDTGFFPPLPVFPEAELGEPSLAAPAGVKGEPEARFGHLDETKLDEILTAAFTQSGEGETAAVAPRTLAGH